MSVSGVLDVKILRTTGLEHQDGGYPCETCQEKLCRSLSTVTITTKDRYTCQWYALTSLPQQWAPSLRPDWCFFTNFS